MYIVSTRKTINYSEVDSDEIDYTKMKHWTTQKIEQEYSIENPFHKTYKYYFKSYENMDIPYDILIVIEYTTIEPVTDEYTCIYELVKLFEEHFPELMI